MRAARARALVCCPESAPTYLDDSVGNENQTIMVDLSNSSNMTSHDKLLEEYRREYNRVVRSLLLPYATAQDVVKIKEWELPSTIDILMEMQSSGTLSDALSNLVQYLIDQEIQESAIEKPANNPCKSLPDVAGQDAIQLSQAKFVDPKSNRKSTETISSTSTPEGQQNKSNGTDCASTGLTGLQTGLTAPLPGFPELNQNLRWLSPKNLRLVFGKQLKPKAVISMKRKG